MKKTILAIAAAAAATLAAVPCYEQPKNADSSLAGIWKYVCQAGYKGEWEITKLFSKEIELFSDGTGIVYGIERNISGSTAIKWQLRDGNRLQVNTTASGREAAEINDIELSENGAALTFHYDGLSFSGKNPRKAVYLKRGAKKETNAPFAFADARDGKEYKAVKIGEQTWMAENLNFEAKGSKCYENKPENCAKYGRLYNWETAVKACPAGWHLPSDAEWGKLFSYADGSYRCADGSSYYSNYSAYTADWYLKAASGWDNGNGIDSYGFAAMPSGYGRSDGNFGVIGWGSYWWSIADGDAGNVHISNNSISRNNTEKNSLQSVRCLQDSVNR